MPNCVVIVSGGMDSVTLLHHLVIREQLIPAVITFKYGQKHAKEIEYAKINAAKLDCPDHKIVDLMDFTFLFSTSALVTDIVSIPNIDEVKGNPQPPTYVPNRNMIFLALAVAYAESIVVDNVYYGAQAHDMYGYWDTTPTFLERVNSVYQLNRRTPVTISAPFIQHTKADILRVGLELGVDYAQTWSCYSGQELACGQCPTCAERLNAFAEVGISDPLQYLNHS